MPRKPPSKIAAETPKLAMWETSTGVAAAAQPGLLPYRAALPLTALLFGLFSVFLWPLLGLSGLVVAALFARLIALDITTYTLPNVYTLPMLAVGGVYALTHGLFVQSLLACLLLLCLVWLLARINATAGFGAGDLKLMAVLFAFTPAPEALFALSLGSLLWMPVAMFHPRRPVPFGIPILLGWLVLLRFPDLPNAFFSTIS